MQALHAVCLLKQLIVIENFSQITQIFPEIDPKVMRMPPEVVQKPVSCGIGQIGADAANFQRFQKAQFLCIRTKEPAGWNISGKRGLNLLQRVAVMSRQIDITVQKPHPPPPNRYFTLRTRLVDPGFGISPEASDPQFFTHGQIFRVYLIARKDQAPQFDMIRLRHVLRRGQIRLECFLVLSFFQTIIMRKRVGSNSLMRI